MRRLFILLLLIPTGLFAQFTDSFSDSNFKFHTTWFGDITEFEVVNDSLHLNAPAVTEESYLSRPSTAINNAVWKFRVMFEENPSSSNKALVYLVSDQVNLEGPLNGYFVMVGNTSDEISLYRQNGTATTKIIDGTDKILNYKGFIADIMVTRNDKGTWSLSYEVIPLSTDELISIHEGIAFDNTYNQSSYFGIVADYTSTRSKLFWFDDLDVSGDPFIDTIAPELSTIRISGDSSLTITMSEEIKHSSSIDPLNYMVDQGLGNPIAIAHSGNTIELYFGSVIELGKLYTLEIDGIEDMSGNMLATSTEFGIIEQPASGDIVLNELLFNPRGSGSDFIELYNNSDKLFDLSEVQLANFDRNGIMDEVEWASSSSKYFIPGTYVVITEDTSDILDRYTVEFPQNLIQVHHLPAMNNDADDIAVLDSSFNTLDRFTYNEKMHFGLYDDVEGISLERIHPNLPTQDQHNWHSAAANANYATPGSENSQFSVSQGDGGFSLDMDYFSPNGDGYNDLLTINYQLDAPGVTVNIIAFDVNGRLIRRIAKNQTLGTEGVIRWDGITQDGQKARKGIYVLFIEQFWLDGTVKNDKFGFSVNGSW